ncbi:TolC family outer membrane protein [Shumkonia mesophila]|uniref:TolC family outer membrane protein n=1 Tax=Shumkonia mesophila TaxID=2838854 RepID=UPI00293414C8|nr:TolC family outer membrane protein [Shumkonia mesophila]
MKIWSSILVSLAIAFGFHVAGASAQTLEEALAAAYDNNPSLAAARAALRATDEQVPQALSGWRPTVSVNGSYGTSAIRSPSSSGTDKGQHRDPRSMDITIEQPLYQGGRTGAATQRAESTVEAARARLGSTEQAVMLDAITAYMNVVRDQAVLELRVNNEQVLRRQLQATEDRFQVGEVTRTDVYQAEARVAGATADRIQAEGDLEVSRAQYRNIVGEAPGRLQAPPVPADVPADVNAAVNQALANNPDVVAAGFDERASTAGVSEVRGELLPSVTLSGTAEKDYDSIGENTRVTTYEARVSVSVPLYQAGAVYSRLRSARQTVEQNRQNLEAERRTAIEAVTREWETLTTARAAIEAFRSQVTANEIALDGVRREAAVGSRTVLDVLDAEQELLDSRVNLVGAQRNQIVAIYGVKSASGLLSARALDLPVEYYDPEDHYREVRDKWVGGTSSGDAHSK